MWTENILKTELSENDGVTTILWFPWPSFPQTQIQNDRWLLVFKFLLRSVDGKHWMHLQSETFDFKFLQRSVDGKHLMRFQSETFVFKFLWRSADGTLVSQEKREPTRDQTWVLIQEELSLYVCGKYYEACYLFWLRSRADQNAYSHWMLDCFAWWTSVLESSQWEREDQYSEMGTEIINIQRQTRKVQYCAKLWVTEQE